MLTAKPLSLLAALLIGLTSMAQTYTLDWGSSFSPVLTTNATSGTATNINGSGRNLNMSMAFTGTAAYITNYPQVNSDNSNSALFQVQNSTDAFLLGINLGAQTSYLTVTLNFTGGAVQNLNFGIADIDGPAAGTSFTYLDSIHVVGTSPTGATVIPTITKYNTSSTIFNVDAPGQTSANSANGANVTSTAQGSPAQDGTAFVNFGGDAISSITIYYTTKNLPIVSSDPGAEAIALGNFKFDAATPPTANAIINPIIGNGSPALSVNSFSGSDDESVASYTVNTLPSAASGVLSYYNGTAYVAVTAGQSLTPAQATTLRFDPDPSFIGNATFTYTAVDNRNLVSTAATYTIPVEPTPAPIANNITAPVENSSYGQTSIPSLSAAVAAGTINSYTIQTIPTVASGVLYLCNSTCNPVTAGQSIAPADIAKLKFDPAATFTGTASFTYNATSDATAVSNTATYSIPVRNEPPMANTILAQVFRNTDPAAFIPALSGADADGTIASFTIATLPTGAMGTLQYCNSSCTAVTAGQVIAAANADKLKFTPAAGYIGTARFTYTTTDNSGNISPAASYNIPVKGAASVNVAPYSDNRVAPPVANTSSANLLPVLSAHDVDGTIASYTIESIPTAAQGTLTYCSNGTEPCTGTVTPAAAAGSLTAAQMATLKFTPAATFSGVASFTYSATDNSGNKSNTATYSMPVLNVPPVANPIVASTMNNGAAQTAIPSLSGHSTNTISTYTISSIPSAASGLLYLCNGVCTPVVAGQTVAVADIAKLTFDPAAGFTGNAAFNYNVTDNNGLVSSDASYIIPITGSTLPSGVSPIALNRTAAAIASNAGQTVITALSASDADGTVSSYTINSLPPATAGVLYLCNSTCNPVTAGQSIVPADIAKLKFTPVAGYEGNTLFDYSVIDNSGKASNIATFTIPVIGAPPVANNIQTANLSVAAPSTAISSLSGSDADGSVVSYTINSLPSTASGVLYLCNGSCTAVTAGQVIVAADASKLQFDPAGTYTGIYTQFNYSATDNSGKISSMATYTIPLYLGKTLPVSLLGFSGRMVNEVAQLSWIAENEINFDRYVVERSLDGTTYIQLGNVQATSGDGRKTYGFNDNLSSVAASKVYYRLQMVDRDGSISYSSIVMVTLTGKGLTVSVPNPVHGTMIVQVNSDKNRNASFQLIDNLGHVLASQTQYLTAGINTVTVNGSNRLPGGLYTLRIVCDSEVIIKRLIVQE